MHSEVSVYLAHKIFFIIIITKYHIQIMIQKDAKQSSLPNN